MTLQQLTELGITADEWAAFGPLEKLFADIGRQLAGVGDLRWIDLEAGQLEIPEDDYPVQFPCVLIDFPDSMFSDDTRGNQQGLINVQIRLAIDLYEDLHMVDQKDAPDKGMALKRLNLVTRAHQALQGFETEYSNKLSRTGIQTERRDDGIKVFVMNYVCAAKDSSAAVIVNSFTGSDLELHKS